MATKILYLCKKGRFIKRIGDSKKDFCEELDRVEDCQRFAKDQEEVKFRSMETCRHYNKDANKSTGTERGQPVNKKAKTEVFNLSGQKIQRVSGLGKKALIIQQLKDVLLYYKCAPFSATCTLRDYQQNDSYAYYNATEPLYKKAVNIVSSMFTKCSYKELYSNYQISEVEPYFYSRNRLFYLDLEISYIACLDLLLYQYGSMNSVKLFIIRFYNILEKQIPKRNTMFVYGNPNSGEYKV